MSHRPFPLAFPSKRLICSCCCNYLPGVVFRYTEQRPPKVSTNHQNNSSPDNTLCISSILCFFFAVASRGGAQGFHFGGGPPKHSPHSAFFSANLLSEPILGGGCWVRGISSVCGIFGEQAILEQDFLPGVQLPFPSCFPALPSIERAARYIGLNCSLFT